ncbi:aldehyde dehydrogenase [Clostridium bowmanii]|uniref:aldehyde dehydrogenase n=1 Tax=Clostridium bowmanii TaxID=132925 RepID=UPI001C0D8C44|nr:aldehyde dehydrogenase [Clostridium bowmanii]MBU3190887.1 aldehyde dehydrogenase [Clostridium bowmanii]MCA1075205.1 aldehyde dehydrogenase [Clostridium bowmanii]
MSKIKRTLEKQRKYFDSGATRNLDFRIEKLCALKKSIKNNEKQILEALWVDLHKSEFEAYATEIGIILEEINFAIKHLKSWAKTKKVRTPLTHFLSSSYIYSEPYGVSLIISPWNYPFQLLISPLIGSIAAGNCAMLKPSENAPKTTEVIIKIIEESFSEEFVCVVEAYGGKESSEALLKEAFNYIFFTGSVPVGKIVMEAASKHLTPVTLELGGKSPCIVDKDTDIKLAAKRIAWGKFINAGQTCVAPDYILVHKSVKEKLITEMAECIVEFFGENPEKSNDFPRIINKRQFDRLIGLLGGGKIVTGGEYNRAEKYIAPTIIDNITWNDPIMLDEIFGPILPILEFDDLGQVIEMVNSRPKPLALYLFSNNKKHQERIIDRISYGGGCINDTIMHVASPYLPFGGVGASGMNAYHGKGSYDVFSHKKSVTKKSNLLDVKIRYAPYSGKIKLLKKLMK